MFLESLVNFLVVIFKIVKDEEGIIKKFYNYKNSKVGKFEGFKILSIELLSDMCIVIKKIFLGFLLLD